MLLVKQFNDGKDASFYVASTMDIKKQESQSLDRSSNDELSTSRPASEINIADLISKINSSDGD